MKIRPNASPHKLRDINITIDWHYNKNTLAAIGKKYGLNPERIRQIHYVTCKWVFIQASIDREKAIHAYHCQEGLDALMKYRDLLMSAGVVDRNIKKAFA